MEKANLKIRWAISVLLLVPAFGSLPAQAAQSGLIVAWGYNDDGQCNVPAPNSDFIAIAAGWLHSLGLKDDGSVAAWGDNGHGLLNVPAPNSGFIAIAAGGVHGLGLKVDGSVAAWGYNAYGQLNVPAPNSGFIAIAADIYHSLGLKEDGSVAAWGWNAYGQCNVPAPNSGFTAIAAGSFHGLGLKEDGSVVGWGSNYWGQCNIPAPNSSFVAIAAGYAHSLGLKEDGSVAAWGWNYDGQCNVPAPNSGFIAISAGAYHSLGLKSDGSIVGWGSNYNWDGTVYYGQSNVPAPNSGFIAIAAGYYHSLALVREVGTPPVANAGAEQVVYAWIDGIAEVVLDGSGSFDADGDELEYFWFEGDEQIATGVDPNVQLSVGEHIIELIVNDGSEDSEPNAVLITVVEAVEVWMKFTPQALNPGSQGNWVKSHLVLTEGFGVDDVDADTPAKIAQLGIESEYMNVFINEEGLVEIEAAFRRGDFCAAINYGPGEVTAAGRLTSGQYFCGSDTIKIITNNLGYVGVLASYWLEADCGPPDWCGGLDVDQDSIVDWLDFAMSDGCCIKLIKE